MGNMAKRKRIEKVPARREPETTEGAETVAFQVRFDADLHARLKAEAEKADISLNQLIQGICRGTVDYLHQGEAEQTEGGFVSSRAQKRCIFFGKPGVTYDPDDLEYIRRDLGGEPATSKGFLWFSLDFTNRGVVRHQPR
jgi:hypothetical protein